VAISCSSSMMQSLSNNSILRLSCWPSEES